MKEKDRLKLLFIGNSHTFFNDMPELVARLFREAGVECQAVMLAHGGWSLSQHVNEPEVRFNIQYGGYDYVILQERISPFGPEEELVQAVSVLNQWIRESGAKPVLYMAWSARGQEGRQEALAQAHRRLAQKTGMLLIPVGEYWWDHIREHSEEEMYQEDWMHATISGSEFVAKIIYEELKRDL